MNTTQVLEALIPMPAIMVAFVGLSWRLHTNLSRPIDQGFRECRAEYRENRKELEAFRGEVHINGVESFWSMLKRPYHGTCHKMSFTHLRRYTADFAARHNVRDFDALDQMAASAKGMEGRRLRYADLIVGRKPAAHDLRFFGLRAPADREEVPYRFATLPTLREG